MSVNFRLEEFRDPTTGEAQASTLLLQRLEMLRAELGNVPITITSGYRSPVKNQAVGGAQDSQHLQGNAADIRVAGKTPAEVAAAAKRVGFTGIGTYPKHTHVDVRPGPLVTWTG